LQRPDQPYPVCSAVAVPFISRGAVIGVLTLTHAQPNHFAKAHEELLGSAADQIAIALDNAKMFDTMMRMADRMGLLYTLSDLATGADLEDTLTQSVRAIRQATHWPGLAVMLPDESRNTLITHASAGSSLPDKLSVGDALIVDAWCTCKTMVVVSQDSPVLVAPMCADERPLGVLLVKGDPANAFMAEDIELVSSAADALTTAVVNAELRRKVEELSQRG
jgi:K+-sensing histidine kinase KdpD